GAWAGRGGPAGRRLGFAGLSGAALAAGILVGVQQDYSRVVTPDFADEILSGSLLAGESAWTLDAVLESYLSDADENEEG
ncbi:hypothetical protein H8E07_07435, partial [bacterium]|nr:hypothetical protein [bacterium]